jgi:glyoxylase-like metal-dependent hydrolase (beta-lactamase superfamily II)
MTPLAGRGGNQGPPPPALRVSDRPPRPEPAPRAGSPDRMLEANVAPGVHRIEDAFTNWYLVEDDGRLTIVDTGVPTSWESFQLGKLGRSRSDVAAVVLTHGHFDHVVFAERARGPSSRSSASRTARSTSPARRASSSPPATPTATARCTSRTATS